MKKFQEFDDLPDWVKEPVRRFRPNDADTWILKPVPALDNRALIDVMNSGEDGERRVRLYLNNVMGKFFPSRP